MNKKINSLCELTQFKNFKKQLNDIYKKKRYSFDCAPYNYENCCFQLCALARLCATAQLLEKWSAFEFSPCVSAGSPPRPAGTVRVASP